jgi:hypothetical protein
MIEPRIEFGIVAFVLHHSAGMRDRGPRAKMIPTSVRLSPSTTWARYMATWRAKAVRGEPRVVERSSRRGTPNRAATAGSTAFRTGRAAGLRSSPLRLRGCSERPRSVSMLHSLGLGFYS